MFIPADECDSINSATAARTVSALPTTIGSPQPMTPSSVSIFRNSQRGGTLNTSKLVIFTGWLRRKDSKEQVFWNLT